MTNNEKIYLKDYKKPNYLVNEVHLTFEINSKSEVIVKSKMHAKQEEAGDLVLDCGSDVDVQEILINGKSAKYDFDKEAEQITLQPADIADDENFIIETTSVINPEDNKSMQGLYQSGNLLVTQCEPQGFRTITPFIDRPDNMAIYKTTIIASKSDFPVLLSNGNAEVREDLFNGRHSVTFFDPFRKPSYLFALVAGKLEKIEDSFQTKSGREIHLEILVEKGNEQRCQYAMDSLKRSMKWDEERFDLECDLDEFKIVAVNDFNAGAMENKGLNIFNAKYVLADPETATDGDYESVEAVIGHEYFHNWTGNRVTCRDWFQLTLKEGLTVFRDQEFTSDLHSRLVKRIDDVRLLRDRQFQEDAGPNKHPIRPESYKSVDNFYTLTVYEKGAEIIRMIHTMIGEDNFQKGMKLYFERHDGQAVTTEDFVAAMEDASGMDMTVFKQSWYSQAGTPTCKVSTNYDQNNSKFDIKIEQIPAEKGQVSYQFPLSLGVMDENGNDIHSEDLIISEQTHTLSIPAEQKPKAVSLLRNFSAPMKLDYDYSSEELCFLMMHDKDQFNRYEAGHRLALDCLRKPSKKKEMELLDALKPIFKLTEDDPDLAAQMLILPTIRTIVQDDKVQDYPEAQEKRDALIKKIAQRYEAEFKEIYEKNSQDKEYKIDGESIAKRTLKNVALSYLTRLDGELRLAKKQFADANNMTDSITALRLLSDYKEGDSELRDFYRRWHKNALVFGKYVATIASCKRKGLLDKVKEIEILPEFNIENPNNIYCLYGVFANNMAIFHGENAAENYKFFADRVIQITDFNGRIAANIAKYLSVYKMLPLKKRSLLKKQLKRIYQAAKDNQKSGKQVLEIVENILNS